MNEEIIQDNNCIVKAFENNPISILHENINNKKIYYFKANDIGKALKLSNIAVSIQSYDDDERVLRKAYDSNNIERDTTFLTSQGVYRLLYNSKKDGAKKFRKWAGNILDDIIFNESKELKRQLEEKDKLHRIELKQKQDELEESSKQLLKLQKFKVKKWYNQEPGDTVYAVKIESGLIKLGKAKNVKDREAHYINDNAGEMFYIKKCYNCDLTEKVLHHILDKHRVENHREWFDISNELAIYIIDIVCDFLDKFVNISEQVQEYKIKEFFESLKINFNNENLKVQEPMLNKIVNIESNEDKIKKFIDEYCEFDESYYVLSYELLGSYRIWARGFNLKDRTYFTQYIKKHYKSKKRYYQEFDKTSLLVYIGLRPKQLTVTQENKDILQKYEEFVLNECKYNYTYRIRYSDFITEYTKWYKAKYPEYSFSKEEKINMEAYLNRHFLKDKINMPGHLNVPGIWGIQLKSDNSFRLGTNPASRKAIVKINSTTKQIIEEYNSVIIASEKLNLDRQTIRNLIKNKKVKDNFILEYKSNIELLELLE